MIVMRAWNTISHFGRPTHFNKGWFLFGFIPIYVIRVEL